MTNLSILSKSSVLSNQCALQDEPTPSVVSESESRNLQLWFCEPTKAFNDWVLTHQIKDSTRKVKGAMWGKFCRWMSENGLKIEHCTDKQIAAFFKDEGILKEQRYRYIMLIELVYAFLISLGLSLRNPGQEASYAHLGDGSNDQMRFFTQDERALIEAGVRRMLVDGLESVDKEERLDRKDRWSLQRDAALIGVLWGGGLRVSEVCELSVNCTLEDGVLVIPSSGQIQEHRTQLLPLASDALAVWLPVRKSLSGVGHQLFPPDASRRRHDVVAALRMHPSNVFRRVNALLKTFGLSGPRITPQTLRNTFAAVRIEQGWNDGMIMSSMGLVEDTTLMHMREKYKVWAANPNTHSTQPARSRRRAQPPSE